MKKRQLTIFGMAAVLSLGVITATVATYVHVGNQQTISISGSSAADGKYTLTKVENSQSGKKEFNETKEFIKDVNFSGLHVFPYSARQGTVAYKFKDIPYEIKKNRTEILLDLDKELKKEFILKNKTGKILIEEVHDNVSYGLTENYIRCFVNQRCTVGDILNVSILQEKDGMAFARLI